MGPEHFGRIRRIAPGKYGPVRQGGMSEGKIAHESGNDLGSGQRGHDLACHGRGRRIAAPEHRYEERSGPGRDFSAPGEIRSESLTGRGEAGAVLALPAA